MRVLLVVGVLLIILGTLALAYGGIHYTTHKKIVDIGSFQATTTEQKTFPLPPILGAVCLVGGIVLVVTGRKGN
jgi:uncharacterized membrane protein YidH (DUF202 family)